MGLSAVAIRWLVLVCNAMAFAWLDRHRLVGARRQAVNWFAVGTAPDLVRPCRDRQGSAGQVRAWRQSPQPQPQEALRWEIYRASRPQKALPIKKPAPEAGLSLQGLDGCSAQPRYSFRTP